jgi:hypothetical protein
MKGRQPVKNGTDYAFLFTARSGSADGIVLQAAATYHRSEPVPLRSWARPSGVLLPADLEAVPAFVTDELHRAMMSLYGVQGVLLGGS